MARKTTADNSYCRRRKASMAAGTWIPQQPVAVVAAHLERLYAAGMDTKRIAVAAGVNPDTVQKIRRHWLPKVKAGTAKALLSLPIAPVERRPPGRYVWVVGSTRRIRALVAIGHSVSAQATEIGRTRAQLQDVANGRHPYVNPVLAVAVADLYRRWRHTPALPTRHSTAARNMAARKGWHGPDAWDDELGDIDNPAAEPYLGAPVGPDYVSAVAVELVATGQAKLLTLTDAERLETVARLSARMTPAQIALRVSTSVAVVRGLLNRLAEDEQAAA
jgi:DNA-binding CsgD family transcriptional regulator